MNSPFVIYSKRQLYLSILFIVLLLEVFTILPTSSTFVNNGNSLKHKIVQYLNHEKNTAQSSRFHDEDEKNKADTVNVDNKMDDLIKSLRGDIDPSSRVMGHNNNVVNTRGVEESIKNMIQDKKKAKTKSIPHTKKKPPVALKNTKRQQQDDKRDTTISKTIRHDTTIKSPHRFLRLHTESKKNQGMIRGQGRDTVHNTNQIQSKAKSVPNPLSEYVQPFIAGVGAQGSGVLGALAPVLTSKLNLVSKKIQAVHENVRTQLKNLIPVHELLNTEGFNADVSQVAGGSTYSPICEALNGKFDKQCGSVSAAHSRNNCKRLTHQIMQMCWLSEQRGLQNLGLDA